MERFVDLQEISDGRLYRENDLVKADCGGCSNCSQCCRGMEDTIVLDPMDVYRLTTGLGVSFEQLMEEALELHLQDGVILPNLKMQEDSGSCFFLNEEGRCKVHSLRPGFCRLFPLGRVYESGDFAYFLQTHECPFPGKTKVKVKKWIDTPELSAYHEFVNDWHDLRKTLGEAMEDLSDSEQRTLQLFLLKLFYQNGYEGERSFYEQYKERRDSLRQLMGV